MSISAATADRPTLDRRWPNALRGMGFFSLAGPLIGGLAFAFTMFMTLAIQDPKSLADFPAVLFVMVFFAYALGVLPAAIAGGVVGWFRPAFRSWRSSLIGGAIGFAVAVCCGLVLFGGLNELIENPSKLGSAVVIFGLPGMLAGTVATWLFTRKQFHPVPRRSNPMDARAQ